MADNLPINFAIPGETTIASYSWTDVAEGTGIVHFKGARASVDATAANDIYYLTEQSCPSIPISTDIATGDPSATEINFDVTFNTPRTIDGRCYIFIPCKISSTGGVTPKITIYKWNGLTETTLVSQVTLEVKTGTVVYVEWAAILDIPKTNFKVGETLRVCLNFVSSTSSFLNNLSHNPQADTTAYTETGGRLSVYVPFKLNL